MEISVIVPAHNPHRERLRRTLAGLKAQGFDADRWECILVDNASNPRIEATQWTDVAPRRFFVVHEPILGLSAARKAGIRAATANRLVLVDDDNVLAPDYLEQVDLLFDEHETLGAVGGRSLPQFESQPAAWVQEFLPLLALRDLGEQTLFARGLGSEANGRNRYPSCAPIGAGMALRRQAVEAWLAGSGSLTDRRGADLTSAGDNEIVFSVLAEGWTVAYSPNLRLTHLIPVQRLQRSYLARLNRGIQKSWVEVLQRHDASPWPPLSPLGARIRMAKAWFGFAPWRTPAAHVRWQGALGHFEGRIVRN